MSNFHLFLTSTYTYAHIHLHIDTGTNIHAHTGQVHNVLTSSSVCILLIITLHVQGLHQAPILNYSPDRQGQQCSALQGAHQVPAEQKLPRGSCLIRHRLRPGSSSWTRSLQTQRLSNTCGVFSRDSSSQGT